ncbi:MAG: hypothetical protein G01um10147_997 [Microgenomates group bacterium Gr01-1014_7]|nr:MAG: hypothetical protein G01um10147_997 [Microgenomates group bacterium Gr01-1014_7]
MSIPKERDPAEGISGIDTFITWFDRHVEELHTDPRIRRRTKSIPSVAKDYARGEDIWVVGHPWTEVPESLQIVIGMQYDSAHLPGLDKDVDVWFHMVGENYSGLSFILNADTIAQEKGITIDRYGEVAVSSTGVQLDFRSPFAEYLRERNLAYGLWMIKRGTLSAENRMRKFIEDWHKKGRPSEEELSSHANDIGENNSQAQVTLLHWQDTARFLVRAIPYTEITAYI